MCRNIRPLFNFEPPATETEIQAAALQFIRKISGFTKPSHSNETAFNEAVRDVSQIARTLIDSLQTTAPPKDRAVQAHKARERSRVRFPERAHGSKERRDDRRGIGAGEAPAGPQVDALAAWGAHPSPGVISRRLAGQSLARD